MRKGFFQILLILLGFTLFAEGTQELPSDVEALTKAKNVILFIGDGMAMPQITSAEAYLQSQTDDAPGVKKLVLSQFPAQGLTTTHAANKFITDSAAAGTAIACGQKTESGVISMDASKTVVLTSIAELAKQAGKKVGIVSTVNLDHATPAVFYAHNVSRKNYYDISMQMVNSGFDFFGGGMVRIDKTPEGEQSAHDIMQERGWTMVSTPEELATVTKESAPVYAYTTGFAGNAMDYIIDQDPEKFTITELTEKAIEVLDSEDGFFLMVEGGKIDWACHANDAAASIHNTIALDKAIEKAIEFYNANPEDTLIIATGDHETGGLTLGFAGTKYESAFAEIGKQKMSYEGFNKKILADFKADNPNGTLVDILPQIEMAFGLDDLTEYEMELLENAFVQSMSEERDTSDKAYLLYGGYEPLTVTLTHILNNRAGLAWTSYSHTGVPVPIFAMGASADMFDGYYDNTDIFHKILAAMHLETKVSSAK